MTKEELKEELEKLKDFKVYVFEWDVYVKAEDFRKKAIECIELREENKKLKWLQICWKTVAERIEDDKKIVRIDTSCMEEDTLQELREIWELKDDELIYEEWLYD